MAAQMLKFKLKPFCSVLLLLPSFQFIVLMNKYFFLSTSLNLKRQSAAFEEVYLSHVLTCLFRFFGLKFLMAAYL